MSVALCLIAIVAANEARDPLHARIDQHIAAGFADYAKNAAPIASDAEFLRRVYLDLSGTIPTVSEFQEFMADRSPNKREKVIDRLMNSFGYVRRMVWFFDVTLMERRPDQKVPRAAWESYLQTAIAENRPYDVLVREILSSDGSEPNTRAAAKFFLERDMEPHLVTRDLTRIFLGRNLQCAQCHDHPSVDDYSQAEYYGIQAFVSRSFLFPNARAANAVIAEKADGIVNFVSVFDKAKKQYTITPKMPGGKAFAEPNLEKGKEYKPSPASAAAPASTPPKTKPAPAAAATAPIPVYSRRALLAKAMTEPENTAFARTAVNRIWAMMLGRGLIHSPEWDHEANPPSHPELLELLTSEFVRHNHDIKWLVREIALTQTYQRSSEIPESLANRESIPADRYLVAELKPLSAEHLAYAISQAGGQTDTDRAALGPKGTEAQLDARVAPRIAPFRSTFAAPAGEPEDGFTASLHQTLFLKYGAAVRGMLATRSVQLGRLTDPTAVAEQLFISVLSRYPTADEVKDVTEALGTASDRNATLAELTWALVASAEFRFNH